MEFHYDYKICKKCGGKCCKSLPGAYFPDDIKKIFGSVEEAITSGSVAIDWLEADEPGYYLRPKTILTDSLYDGSWGGACIHLKENGCELSEEKRPSSCKAIKPSIGGECSADFPKPFKTEKEYASHLYKEMGIDLSIYRYLDR